MVHSLPVSDIFVAALAYLALAHGLYYVAGQIKPDAPESLRERTRNRESDV